MKRIATPLNTSHLIPNDAALLRCNTALELSHAGDYKRALETMSPLWANINERPRTNSLHPSVAAELYLSVATLIRRIKKKDQDQQLRNLARELINKGTAFYQTASDRQKTAACQIELGYSYYYAGEFQEARAQFGKALENLKTEGKTKAKALAAVAALECTTHNYQKAFRILQDNSTLFFKTGDRIDKGTYHHQLAIILQNRAIVENQTNLLNQAIIEYQTADEALRLSKDLPLRIDLKVDLATVLRQTKRNKESHQLLNNARRLAATIKDKSRVATIDQLQADLFLSERKYTQTEGLARKAAALFTKTNQPGNTSQALTLQAVALARLQKSKRAEYVFDSAFEIAHKAGTTIEAGIASLSMTEELTQLPTQKLRAAYIQARTNLATSRDQTILLRLLQTADKLLQQPESPTQAEAAELLLPKTEDLHSAVSAFERGMIQAALTQSSGKVTHAAKLLNITYQSLSYTINTRHKDLLSERSPLKHRIPKHQRNPQAAT